ncbi:DUF4097 family beta strand repeat-containing protein [Levilactobacillus fuyuanensis]|uniref:DUF4097 family beta strand repeat-containing protein n=1 Tax=Levilactobacillus fuyuanensis TaxID=2486022 RepID=A0ABW4H430_9LACO|nr:DUF4097 family beta strand repeat-containing protein [Levilactobacillus fuyuanensis]
MDDITMEIRTRLDQLFSQYQPSRALTELKEELVGDLTEAVTDKINQGVTATKAIDEAMSQLGDIDTLLKEVAAENTAQADNQTDDFQQADATSGDADAQANADTGEPSHSRVQIGKLHITDDQVTWGDHVVVDGGDKVDLGKLVQVDGDHVSVGNGFIDVDGDDVKINGERPQRAYVGSLRLVNTQSFAVTDVTDVVIDYPDAAVKIGQASASEIVVNEYMSRDSERFYLRSKQYGSQLELRQGDRPRLWPLHVRTEIFIPSVLKGNVRVHAGNGSLEVSDLRSNADFDIRATNGSVRAFNNQTMNFEVQSTNGSVRLNQLTALNYRVVSTNGSVTVDDAQGTGKIESTNGAIRLANHTGDAVLNSRNGAIKVNGFTGQLASKSRNGAIRVQNLAGGGRLSSGNGRVSVQVSDLTSNLEIAGNASAEVEVANEAYSFDVRNDDGTVRVPRVAQLTLDDSHHKIGAVGETPVATVKIDTVHGSVRVE